MELWIRSQDKEQLIKPIGFYYDYQQEKHHITCYTENDYYWVGIYKSKERALEVLDEIQDHILNLGETVLNYGKEYKTYGRVYEMPKE